MSFQIHNSEGIAIPINKLDEEAAIFWGKEIEPKNYACPQKKEEGEGNWHYISRCANWFDVIGYCIHSPGYACSGWSNVVATMITEPIGMKFIDTSEGYKDRPIPIVEFVSDPNTLGQMHLPNNIEEKIWGVLTFYKPYIELINHWQSKGYIPVQIKD